jgi:type II secretory pathway pseudopilin PulG
MITHNKTEQGFSLVESMVALGLLTGGLLGLAAVLSTALSTVTSSSADQLAKDKAYEALESIVAARETKLILWGNLKNAADGGVFLDGAQAITLAGADGIIGTSDDTSAAAATLIQPGPDEAYGTADDRTITFTNFTRQIQITNASPTGAPDTLRQVVVTIRYASGGRTRSYQLTTLVSSYS